MRPGATKSIVWQYFQKNEGGKSATCSMCKKIIRNYGGTSNLRQHLIRIHHIQMSQSEAPIDNIKHEEENEGNTPLFQGPSTSTAANPPIQINASTTSTVEPVPSKKKKFIGDASKMRPTKQLNLFCGKKNNLSESQIAKIDTKLLKMITRDFQPLSIVENKGFLEYSKALQPLYKPPSRKRLSTVILPRYYSEAVSALKTDLQSVKNAAITTDIWTSDSNIGYITLTAHFIFNDKLHAHVLSTKDIYGSHTGENIANVIKLILTEWNLFEKIVAVVSDNGANIKNAITVHLQKHHHPCVAHTLNLSVDEALSCNEKLNVVLKKCRAFVAHFKHSTSANDKFKSIQEQMGFSVLNVKQDVATRWNSCYTMLERMLKIKDALSVCVINLPKCVEFLDAEEWIIISDCVQVLKPANLLTNIFSSETYPTASLIVPLIRAFQSSLKNVNTCTEATGQLKNSLLDVITRRLGILERNKTVAKATFLDPRFKKIGFGTEDNATNAQKWVTEELSDIVAHQHIPNNNLENGLESQNVNFDQDDLWSHFDQKMLGNKSFLTPTSMVASMVRQYLEMAPVERKADPLEFWSKYKGLLPEMYQIAMKYLCIPSTSVPSERVFSETGQLTNLRRNRLHPKHLDEIIFLNYHEF